MGVRLRVLSDLFGALQNHYVYTTLTFRICNFKTKLGTAPSKTITVAV